MSEATPAIFHTPKPYVETHIEWTEAGWEQYQAMKKNLADVHAFYGEDAGNYVGLSLYICMERLFSCGPCNVQKDGNSLYVTTPHIVFGVNWHRASDPTVERLTRTSVEHIDPKWPVIGTWSLNS